MRAHFARVPLEQADVHAILWELLACAQQVCKCARNRSVYQTASANSTVRRVFHREADRFAKDQRRAGAAHVTHLMSTGSATRIGQHANMTAERPLNLQLRCLLLLCQFQVQRRSHPNFRHARVRHFVPAKLLLQLNLFARVRAKIGATLVISSTSTALAMRT